MTSSIETALLAAIPPEAPLATVLEGLDLLADVVLTDLAVTMRRKCEHLITELVTGETLHAPPYYRMSGMTNPLRG